MSHSPKLDVATIAYMRSHGAKSTIQTAISQAENAALKAECSYRKACDNVCKAKELLNIKPKQFVV